MLSYGAGAPPAPHHLCPVLTAGLLLVAGLSLLSPPTSVAKDVPQTWHTLPLHHLWPPGLARWHTGLFRGDLLKGDRRMEIVSCIWMRSFAFLEKKISVSSPLSSFSAPLILLCGCLRFYPFRLSPSFERRKKWPCKTFAHNWQGCLGTRVQRMSLIEGVKKQMVFLFVC